MYRRQPTKIFGRKGEPRGGFRGRGDFYGVGVPRRRRPRRGRPRVPSPFRNPIAPAQPLKSRPASRPTSEYYGSTDAVPFRKDELHGIQGVPGRNVAIYRAALQRLIGRNRFSGLFFLSVTCRPGKKKPEFKRGKNKKPKKSVPRRARLSQQ